MRIKNHKIVLAILLILTIITFFVSLFVLISWIPSAAEQLYGEPDQTIDRSQRILLSTQLLVNRKQLFSPIKLDNDPQTFLIESGESAWSVANRLEELKIIPDARSLVNYWLYKGQDRLVQSGVYLIQSNSTPYSIAKKVVNNTPEKIQFAFLPGWRKEEIENLLITSNIFPEKVKIEGIENASLNSCFPSELGNLSTIEGFLYPGEYQIPNEYSPEEILCIFSEKFFESLPANYGEIVKANGLSTYEAVILASIIQKEVILDEEVSIIAGVFLNRLNAEMPLQSDPTVQYAIAGDSTPSVWWKSPLNASDLLIDSPFNTYLFKGLPPAPICNPNLNSLNAVAFPERTDFLYFRAACDGTGSHIFSETYQQHRDAACN
ncbi:MAG: endolytic transglycosylase MltG [Pelolinea sp.]|nr:endolytic transglycosylase MltG [Pelolinea sp.]